jgi:hypothetical protein
VKKLPGSLQKNSVIPTNLSKVEFMKNYYLHYRSWKVVYDYIRSGDCEIPRHLCEMLIHIDENAEEIFNRIERLPVVLCHRDFWVTNIFYSDSKIIPIMFGYRLIEWYLSAESPDEKKQHLHTIQKIYEIRNNNANHCQSQ